MHTSPQARITLKIYKYSNKLEPVDLVDAILNSTLYYCMDDFNFFADASPSLRVSDIVSGGGAISAAVAPRYKRSPASPMPGIRSSPFCVKRAVNVNREDRVRRDACCRCHHGCIFCDSAQMQHRGRRICHGIYTLIAR